VGLDQLDSAVRRIVQSVTERLTAQGAHAVLLTGSHARGTAGPRSDIDLFVVGDGPDEAHEVIDERMVSIHWWTPDRARQRMSHPASAFVSVFAWRDATILHDPLGVAAELKAVAEAWTWEALDREADAWAADRLVGLSEYVSKLERALEDGRCLDAAATRCELAVGLVELAAVANRITSVSENGLWETVAASGNGEWRALLDRALGAGNEDLPTSVAALIELFASLARALQPTLQPAQREVVAHALENLGERLEPLPLSRSS
jgi:hypothetical protein